MPITIAELLIRLGTSILLGGAIGFEREIREQPAGLRTHLLVSLASATFMLVSTQFAFFQHYTNAEIARIDMSRIASNVVVGIGFLGGGAILHAGLRIKGLTTAASLWLVAAVGLAAGAGIFGLAILATATSLFALVALRYLERRFKAVVHIHLRINTEGEFLTRDRVEQLLVPLGIAVNNVDYARDRVRNRSRVDIEVRLPRQELEEMMVGVLEQLPAVRSLRVQRMGSPR